MEPRVLILDEPTAGLDPQGRDMILEVIGAYHREKKATVLLVSHSMEDVARVADRVLVLNHGEVAMFEPTNTIFSRVQELESIGLTVPAVTKICKGLREKGIALPDNIYTVEQAHAVLLSLLKGGDARAV
jgi:energy-coupling factor transport system ATP-binding protein